jgi:hypothetical protein
MRLIRLVAVKLENQDWLIQSLEFHNLLLLAKEPCPQEDSLRSDIPGCGDAQDGADRKLSRSPCASGANSLSSKTLPLMSTFDGKANLNSSIERAEPYMTY